MNLSEYFKDTFELALIKEIEEKGQRLTIPAGSTILNIGEQVRLMPIVLSGIIKVSRLDEEERELLLYYINPNQSCAMTFTCCMEYQNSEIKAVAEDEVDLLGVPVNVMDVWLSTYPTWKSFVMRTIKNRFNEMLKTIDQIAFQKLDERLIHYLKEKSRVTESSLINLSHKQIAEELASSREVISRLLKKLEQDKKVLLYRNQIKLLKDL